MGTSAITSTQLTPSLRTSGRCHQYFDGRSLCTAEIEHIMQKHHETLRSILYSNRSSDMNIKKKQKLLQRDVATQDPTHCLAGHHQVAKTWNMVVYRSFVLVFLKPNKMPAELEKSQSRAHACL